MFEQVQVLRTFARMAWLYRWAGMVLASILCIAGWGLVQWLPDTYQVGAKVFLDTRSMLRPLLSGIAFSSGALSDSALLLSRTLLTRPNLEEVARRADLDLKAKSPEDFDALIKKLSARVSITTSRGDNIYDVSYVNENPKVAKVVVDELLNIFMEQSLGDARRDTVTTQNFLEQQIAAYEKRLIEAEDRLKQFKQRNVGIMPGSQGGFFAHLEETQSQLKGANLELREAEQRRDELKKDGTSGAGVARDDLLEALDQDKGESGGASDDLTKKFPELAVFDTKIADLQNRIDEKLLTYTEKYPDVVSMRQLIADYKTRKAKKAKELAAQGNTGSANDTAVALESPYKQQLKLQAVQADATVAALRERVKEYSARVDALKQRVDVVPEIEAELTRLNRDYSVTKSQYDELLKRREQMNMGREADRSEDEVKVKIIEPTRVPLQPTGPNRILYASGVLLVGLAAGAGLAVVLSQLSPRIIDAPDLKALTGLNILGVISMTSNPLHRQQRKVEMTGFFLVLTGLISIYIIQIGFFVLGFNIHAKLTAVLGAIS